MIRNIFFFAILLALLAGCAKVEKTAVRAANASSDASTQESPLLISPEDLLVLHSNVLSAGPSITGSVQPERRADLRAEIAAVVLQVLKENGDVARRGDVLVRLDDTAIRDNLNSAEASSRAATQAYEQAERQFQRLNKLRESGMVSAQELEDGEIRRNNLQSQLEAAKTLAAVARQQLQRTEIRAPFDGIVSDRKVSAGDTAQIGKELVKVIDPGSMRFEGLVSADSIGAVKAGQPVVFRVHGYAERNFIGKITRVNPSANATTRQVEVLVSFADGSQQPSLGGLYAEGRIETTQSLGLTIPPAALIKDGDRTFAWRVYGNVLQKVSLSMGERDPRSGEIALKSGLAEGDKLLRYPSSALRDGQKIEMSAAADSSSGLEPAESLSATAVAGK